MSMTVPPGRHPIARLLQLLQLFLLQYRYNNTNHN
jgi:hypothetical protein